MPTFRTVLAVLVLWNAALWAVVGPLAAPVLPGGWATVLAASLLLLLPVLVLGRTMRGGGYPSSAVRIWVFRPLWYGQLALPLLAAAGAVGALLGWPLGAAGRGGRAGLATAGLLYLALAAWGYLGTRRLATRSLELRPGGLPEGLDGLRIVQLSDLHVGPHTPRRHLARVAEAVRRARPELIVHTGDQVDDYAGDVEPFGAALGGLSAPLGVFAVAGNHDVFAGWNGVRSGLERLGITVLVNRATPVERGGARFWIAGTGDPAGRGWRRDGGAAAAPDVERTLAGVPEGAFVLALAHNPALWPALAERGVGVTLSGHTHYGQLAIPRLGWSLASAFLEHAHGVHRKGGSVLYINPGTNYWGIPLRVGTPPEVTVITLRRAERGDGHIERSDG